MQLIGERETSFDGLIVNYLFDQRESEDKDELSSGDISKYLESEHNIKKNSSYVGHRLKGLGLETKPQKVDKRMKRVINWDLKTMEKLFQKYNASYWIEKNGSKAVSLVSVVSEVAVSGGDKNTKKKLEIITTKMSDFEDKSKNNEDNSQNESNCGDCEKSFKESELKKVKMEDGAIFKVCSSCLPESIAAGGVLLE